MMLQLATWIFCSHEEWFLVLQLTLLLVIIVYLGFTKGLICDIKVNAFLIIAIYYKFTGRWFVMLQVVIFGCHEERLVVSHDSLIYILAHLHYEYILQIINVRHYKMTEEIPDSKGDLFFCLVQLHNRFSQQKL